MTAKAYLAGTHRIRHPAQTWEIVAPKLAAYGITRVADVTGLDTIGIPVVMAVRPMATTLSVAQGKGQNLLLAKVSAVMECIEFWHVENAHPPVISSDTPAAELDLPYRIEELVSPDDGLVSAGTRLDWVAAVGMITGRQVPVPAEMVTFAGPPFSDWAPTGLLTTTNGLASGNNRDEAALHALYEIIERDAMSLAAIGAERNYIDPATVDDPLCSEMIGKILAAGVDLWLVDLGSKTKVPSYTAELWSPDFPVVTLGAGTHLAPEIALSRAITEAAQSRLTTITGSRDDVPPVYDQVAAGLGGKPAPPVDPLPWSQVRQAPIAPFSDLSTELAWATSTVATHLGAEPLLVDLSTDGSFSVVKIIVPGSALDLSRVHPDGTEEPPA